MPMSVSMSGANVYCPCPLSKSVSVSRANVDCRLSMPKSMSTSMSMSRTWTRTRTRTWSRISVIDTKFNPINDTSLTPALLSAISEDPISGSVRYRSSRISEWVPTSVNRCTLGHDSNVIVVAKYLFFSWDSSMSDLWWRRGWWPPSRWSILSNTAHYKKELLTLVAPATVLADGTIILQSTLLHKNLF